MRPGRRRAAGEYGRVGHSHPDFMFFGSRSVYEQAGVPGRRTPLAHPRRDASTPTPAPQKRRRRCRNASLTSARVRSTHWCEYLVRRPWHGCLTSVGRTTWRNVAGGLGCGTPRRTPLSLGNTVSACDPIEQVRCLFLALPEVIERAGHGSPGFFIRGKKQFLSVDDHHHDADHHLGFWCAAPADAQGGTYRRGGRQFFPTPYVAIAAGSACVSMSTQLG